MGDVAGAKDDGDERFPKPTEATNVLVENRRGGFCRGVRVWARFALRFSNCWLTLFPMFGGLDGFYRRESACRVGWSQ